MIKGLASFSGDEGARDCCLSFPALGAKTQQADDIVWIQITLIGIVLAQQDPVDTLWQVGRLDCARQSILEHQSVETSSSSLVLRAGPE